MARHISVPIGAAPDPGSVIKSRTKQATCVATIPPSKRKAQSDGAMVSVAGQAQPKNGQRRTYDETPRQRHNGSEDHQIGEQFRRNPGAVAFVGIMDR